MEAKVKKENEKAATDNLVQSVFKSGDNVPDAEAFNARIAAWINAEEQNKCITTETATY